MFTHHLLFDQIVVGLWPSFANLFFGYLSFTFEFYTAIYVWIVTHHFQFLYISPANFALAKYMYTLIKQDLPTPEYYLHDCKSAPGLEAALHHLWRMSTSSLCIHTCRVDHTFNFPFVLVHYHCALPTHPQDVQQQHGKEKPRGGAGEGKDNRDTVEKCLR